ncbi:endo alpha-1,4 polygalactosaminidase precursor [Cryptococcus neoformans c8]|nr:endo alpha-1,4 polygalactosaminidase precursor [Cryptococcus neoformans var. grubii AD1-83a]OXG54722.1 endo alpha-1,4 polygalactosaminidase precursor [Cryptococcus neoformans var. grubii MW-RSA1955]OXG57999.1 endo alpha-1,4 polygalactosaminidase precursor [Cryptococcus neoformans var. grubii CHC193]OXG61036.1 endo alpha-1,4 polygalactosaminidase precursor [Cryptococcus neoformans var. grubii c8]OXH06922.1 endo alpha-1,4 polygalactosaminidase precursor [Cryptococcus neoformans var. grubii A5-
MISISPSSWLLVIFSLVAVTSAKPFPRNASHGQCGSSSSVPIVETSEDAPSAEETAVASLSIGATPASVTSSSSASAASASSISTVTSSVSLSSTFVYELDAQSVTSPEITTDTGLVINADVYIVDGEGTSEDTIAQYHADGKTVICYFSAGTWEPGRSDADEFDPTCVCGSGGSFGGNACSSNDNKLSGWNEWWLDIHSASCISKVESIMSARISSFVAKGCDGVDPDNVDSFANSDQLHGNTAEDQVNYLLWLSFTARSQGLMIDLKNAGSLLVDDNGDATSYQSEIVEAFDFAVIESCHEYEECDTYDSFLAAGKPEIQIEYEDITTCPSLQDGQHLLVYSQNDLSSALITLECD